MNGNDATITLKYEWDMGHRLPQHEGKCRRLHGHRYVSEVDLTGPLQDRGNAEGMVVDFYILKEILEHSISNWDHRTMLFARDEILLPGTLDIHRLGIFSVPFMPTAENIAAEIMRLVSKELISHSDGPSDVRCTRVRVYETPNGWAEVKAS